MAISYTWTQIITEAGNSLATPGGQVAAAIVAAATAVFVLVVRAAFDRGERKAKEEFEATQAVKKQKANEKTLLRLEEQKSVLAREIAEHGDRRKWQVERRERMLLRIGEAKSLLDKAVSGLNGLVDKGPGFSNMEMITETARALDPYSQFKEKMSHYSVAVPFETLSATLNDHVTQLLLTLSPQQEVRDSPERKRLLKPIKLHLEDLSRQFADLCRDFEREPSKFDYGVEEPPEPTT